MSISDLFRTVRLRFAAIALGLSTILHVAAAQPAAPAPGERELRIGTKDAPPFAIKGKDGSWSGLSIDLWRRAAERLHLRYRFEEASLDELIDKTAAGAFDAAVAAITITSGREKVLDFSEPFYPTGLGIAVPMNAKFNWWRLLDTLISLGFLEALLALIGVTLAIGGIIWLLERRQTPHFSGSVRKGLISSIWWSALTMTQAGADEEPETAPGRIVAIAWMAASVIVIAVFTAGVTSQLTARQLQGVVHGVDDLRAVRVGAVDGTASIDYLTHQRIRYRTFATPQDGMRAVKAGTLDALVYDRPLLAWLAKDEEFSGTVEVLDVTFANQNYAIAFPNNSPLRLPLNQVLLDLIESDWWQGTVAKYLGKD